MKLIKMRYKGFTFPVNPSSIKAELSKTISASTIPFSFSKTQEVGFSPSVISASGSFTGNTAQENARTLLRIFKDRGSAYLFIPGIEPLKAYFKNLSISFNAEKNSADYSLIFVEDNRGKKSKFDFGFTYALEGENLFDIANRTNRDFDKIFEANHFMDMFSVKEGDKVWLN